MYWYMYMYAHQIEILKKGHFFQKVLSRQEKDSINIERTTSLYV